MFRKIYHIDENFCHNHNFFIKKNTFKVALQYISNVFMLSSIQIQNKDTLNNISDSPCFMVRWIWTCFKVDYVN